MRTVRYISAATLFITFAVTTFSTEPLRVSTAFGGGADAQLNEHNNNGNGSGGDLNTRTSSNGDRNEIVALRFDLSEQTLATLQDVTLNIINFRNNSARQVALYGVKQGSIGATGLYSTEDWDENLLTTFGDLPGLLVTDGDFTTQSLHAEQITFLGQITFANLSKGTVETFSDPAITSFIRSYTGSQFVTFILAAAPGYTSTGQARFASKEATALESGAPSGAAGDFAPFLAFTTAAGSVPPSVLITSPVNGADVSSGAPITIEASATDDGTVARVQFYAATEEPLQLLGEDATAPYSFTFTPSSSGTWTVRVVATDNEGLTGEHSITIDVGVANPPNVTITTPAAGASILRGTTTVIGATVTDDVSVAKVQFFAGTTDPLALLGEDSTAPYTFEFTPAVAGSYVIRVVGTDNLGLTASAEILVTVENPPANLRTLSTAVGLGADVQLNEHTDGVSAFGSDLNTRTSVNGDRNEVVALRFDLSEFTLAELSDVTLNIINYRINSARQVALYGVHQGTRGGTDLYSTEDWPEDQLVDFGDVPGLLATDGDFTTQSINETRVTALGQITFANLTKGSTETFSDPALTDFIRAYAGSKLVTFILAAAPGYTSTGQARFASKEALALEGDTPGEEPARYAPYLSFKVGGALALRITSFVRNGNQLTLQWTGGTGPFTVQRKSSLSDTQWTDLATGLTTSTATIDLQGATGFLRLLGQ